MRVVLQGKYAGDIRNFTFDFSSYLAVAEVISGATMVANLYTGILGIPLVVLVLGNTTSVVTVSTSGGDVGNVYDLVVTATTNVGQRLSLNAFLPILPRQP